MRVLWSHSPASSAEVVEALRKQKAWSVRTIKTFLGRLAKKGFVGFDDSSKSYSYFPLVSERDCVLEENEAFLERVHGGELQAMLSSFLDAKKLKSEDIEELRRVLDAYKDQKK
jgi:BlaI family penicillinase repressor